MRKKVIDELEKIFEKFWDHESKKYKLTADTVARLPILPGPYEHEFNMALLPEPSIVGVQRVPDRRWNLVNFDNEFPYTTLK